MQFERPCEHMWDALSAYADGELAPSEALEVEFHLLRCARCSHALTFLQSLATAFGRAPAVEPPTDLRDRILAATVARPRPIDRLGDLFRPWLTPVRAGALGMAGLAALAFVTLVSGTLPTQLVAPLMPGPEARRQEPAPVAPPVVAQVVPPVRAAETAATRRGAGGGAPLARTGAAPALRGAFAQSRPAHTGMRLVSATGGVRPPRVRPVLHPERTVAPVPSPREDGPTAPAETPPVDRTTSPDIAPRVAAAERDDPEPSRSAYVLTAAAPSTGAPVATMAELRQALRRPGSAAHTADYTVAEDRELTVNLVQSRF